MSDEYTKHTRTDGSYFYSQCLKAGKSTSELSPAPGSADGRVILTPEELDAMMPLGERVHTFMQGGPAIIGCDWERSEIIKAARERGAELSGKAATAMKHGAVVWDERMTPVFVETLPNPELSG